MEIALIKLLTNNTTLYNNYSNYIYNDKYLKHIKDNNKYIYKIFVALKELKTKCTDTSNHSVSDLEAIFYSLYPVQKDGDRTIYKDVFNKIEQEVVSEDAIRTLLERFREVFVSREIATLAFDVSEARKPFKELQDKFAELESAQPEQQESLFLDTDIDKLFSNPETVQGVRWKLNCLNKAIGSLRKGNFGFVYARPECFMKGTLIMMADGKPKPIEKIKAGMRVMGPDSFPRHVLASTKGREQMYRVEYPWGEGYVCNENHILQLMAEGKTTASVSVKDYLGWSKKLKHRFKQYKVGVELNTQPYKVDPYVLGVWLGDGTSAKPAFTNADKEVIDYLVEWAGYIGLNINVKDTPSKAKDISVNAKGRGKNTFTQFLNSSRLVGNKHIPDNYLYNDRKVRLQVLAGLIDTDGWKETHGYGFCNKNKILVDQTVWLARSLGFHATSNEKVVDNIIYYSVGIYGEVETIPVKIERKKFTKSTKKPKRNGLNFGFSVTPVGIGDYYGIQVDQDSLYLLHDCTVTHNTGKTAFLITTVMNVLKQNDKPVLWVNNEEASKDVLFRCYYHHFKISFKQLKDNYHYYKQEFEKIYGSRLMFIDNAAVQKRQIEQAVKELNPGFMVIDQLDKVHGFGNNDRYDLLMKQKYQWGRELAKVYCPVIGTCQAGGTGENKKWLQLNDVDSSHTAKQGEADFIIGIGKIDEEGFEDTRYLHVLKNKLPGDEDSIPELRHAKLTVHLDAEHSDYVDKHF